MTDKTEMTPSEKIIDFLKFVKDDLFGSTNAKSIEESDAESKNVEDNHSPKSNTASKKSGNKSSNKSSKKFVKQSGLVIIAKKELRDHMISRKFAIIFGIILITSIIGLITGSLSYNEQITKYAETQVNITSSIHLSSGFYSPTVMSIFTDVSTVIVTLGAILGIAMGFDLITREKESKSLKILLSHPIYRDEVINGKALGGIAALLIALVITCIIALSLMLLFNIVPTVDNIPYLAVFAGSIFLMIASYFAISLFMSTISDSSGNALIYSLIVFIVLSGLFPMLVSGTVVDLLSGDEPTAPDIDYSSMFRSFSSDVTAVSAEINVNSQSAISYTVSDAPPMDEPAPDSEFNAKRSRHNKENYVNPFDTEEWRNYEDELGAYWQKRQSISDLFNLLSPTNNFETIVSGLTYPELTVQTSSNSEGFFTMTSGVYSSETTSTSIMDILAALLKNFIALIAFPVVFLGLAYVKFMRMDIR